MMKYIIVFTVIFMLCSMVYMPLLMAQGIDNQAVEMADTFRSEGKIYVVVLVVTIVFSGLIVYAANTDRKLAKVEKELESLKSSKDS